MLSAELSRADVEVETSSGRGCANWARTTRIFILEQQYGTVVSANFRTMRFGINCNTYVERLKFPTSIFSLARVLGLNHGSHPFLKD